MTVKYFQNERKEHEHLKRMTLDINERLEEEEAEWLAQGQVSFLRWQPSCCKLSCRFRFDSFFYFCPSFFAATSVCCRLSTSKSWTVFLCAMVVYRNAHFWLRGFKGKRI